MASVELKVARIGNSRGVRIPSASLKRYGIGPTVVMEERSDGILLRPPGGGVSKLSWEETAREMAAGAEDWRDLDAVVADGLAEIPWEPATARLVEAEAKARARARAPRKVAAPRKARRR